MLFFFLFLSMANLGQSHFFIQNLLFSPKPHAVAVWQPVPATSPAREADPGLLGLAGQRGQQKQVGTQRGAAAEAPPQVLLGFF